MHIYNGRCKVQKHFDKFYLDTHYYYLLGQLVSKLKIKAHKNFFNPVVLILSDKDNCFEKATGIFFLN